MISVSGNGVQTGHIGEILWLIGIVLQTAQTLFPGSNAALSCKLGWNDFGLFCDF